MSEQPSYLKDISLIVHPDGETTVSEEALLKWFDFLGGKPGEVVLVDNGSHIEVQEVYWALFNKRLIDKLQLSQPSYLDQIRAEEHIQIYTEGSIACKPYILWFSTGLLPYRQGHEDWLKQAIGYLDREEVIAVTSSLNTPKYRDAWEGWYYSRHCNLQFALMKWNMFIDATHEYADRYITAGFIGENPAEAEGDGKDMVKLALERYIESRNLSVLCKTEDSHWTIQQQAVESIV